VRALDREQDTDRTEPTAVYRLFDRDDGLLYVGMTMDLEKRWYAHSRSKAWWEDVARKDVIWFTNRLDAALEESRAISSEAPRHNAKAGISTYGIAIISDDAGNPVEPYIDRRVDAFDEVWHSKNLGRRWHIAVYSDETPVAVAVPIAWFRRACAALGEPCPV
jgi:predicted GIY-YIG superfamily endonuclease